MKTSPTQYVLRPVARAGFSLVEVTLALGIAAFCMIPLFGLLPIGINSNQSAFQQTGGATVAARIMAELRATPATSPQTPTLKLNIPAAGAQPSSKPQIRFFTGSGDVCGTDGSTVVTDGAGNSQFRANVGFVPPTAGTAGASQRHATTVRIVVTWPALTDLNNTDWPKNYQGSFEITTALDRN